MAISRAGRWAIATDGTLFTKNAPMHAYCLVRYAIQTFFARQIAFGRIFYFSHSLNSLPHIPQFVPSILSLTFGIPSIHSLTFPQIPPIHPLNPFPQSIPSQVTFPHKSRSLNSPHITSDSSNSFPQFTPQIHLLNLLLHIPSIHSLTALNSFHQFIPSFPLN